MTAKLFSIWLNVSNTATGTRQEMLRVLGNDQDQVYDFVKKKILHPDFYDKVEEWGDDIYGGFMWSEKYDECMCECEHPEDCECYDTYSVEIEEIEFAVAECVLSLLTVVGKGPYPDFGSVNEFYNISDMNVLAPPKTEAIDPFIRMRERTEA